MTLAAEAAKAAAAEKYKIASVTSNEQYWNRRAAEIAADTGRDLVVAGTPVPAPVGNPTVTISHPQVSAVPQTQPVGIPTTAPAPLAATNVDLWVADESRFDPEGVKALQREWGGDMASNLGYARHWLHTHLTEEQRQRAMDTALLSVPLVRFIAQVARENGHAAPTTATTTTTMKGPSPMSGESRPDALKRFRKLTSELHTARSRQDYLRARELADERDQLSAQLFPGDGSPTADHSGHQVG